VALCSVWLKELSSVGLWIWFFSVEFRVAPWLWVCGYGFLSVICGCGGFVVVGLGRGRQSGL
jgi:hypothetical protein